MSYFRLALSAESEDEEDREYRNRFLASSDQGMAAGHDFDDELYLHQREERDGSRKKVRQMTFFLGVAVVLIIVMAALLIWQHFITTKTPCVSPTCVETAGFIVSKMDVTIDPCQDFYSYACGGWMNKTYPPPDKAKWSTFAATYEKNSKILKRLLEVNGSVYMGKNSTAIAKTKKYFHVCMNKSAVEDKGNAPLLELIKAVGSWTLTSDPVSGQWDKSNWKPLDTLVKVHKLNHASLFGMGITTDDKNTSANIIQFQQSGLTLSSRESYLKNGTEKFHQAFLQYGTEFARLLGADNSSAEKMEAVYQFEKQLAEIFVRAEDMIDPIKTYNKMTVGEFKQIFGESIPLDEYLQRMFGESVPETESVIVSTPSYFKKLNKLLQQTKPETLVDYLVWNLVQVLPGYLPSTFSNAALKLDSVETGITELSPQWSRCVSKADSSFGFASGALFVEDPARFPPDSRTVISDMLGKVRDTFVEELPNIAWMEPSVRQIAIDKALAVEKYVGYPDWIRNPTELDKYYQKVEVTDGFFESMVNLRRFFRSKNSEKRGKVPDTKIWSQTPTTVNAYYSPSHNYFAFPAGILQRPFYDPTFPMSFNYGSIGFVMGHELTHGFDNTGRHHDKHGNLYNWWTKQSIKAFKERSQCMVDQYSQYEVQGKHIKGERTLAENIADNGGLKTAYLTYQKYSSQRTEPEKQLPGLPPNNDKLFFIGFAQVWCSYYTPAYARTAILTDPHSPAKYRTEEEFSEAFGCRKNVDALNPENKCQVW